MQQFRSSYWSCSRLANLIRGTPKPGSETSEGWAEWRRNARKAHPWRFWIAEKGLNALQDSIMLPLDVWSTVRWWLLRRFVYRFNTFRALERDIGPADYVDFGDSIVPIVFGAFCRWVNHVGVDHFEWASTLVFDEEWGESPDSEKFGQPTPQALDAKTVLELYQWWMIERPRRNDPDEESTQFYLSLHHKYHDEDHIWVSFDKMSDEDQQVRRELWERSERLTKEHYQEDTRQLTRLIEMRSHLWT